MQHCKLWDFMMRHGPMCESKGQLIQPVLFCREACGTASDDKAYAIWLFWAPDLLHDGAPVSHAVHQEPSVDDPQAPWTAGACLSSAPLVRLPLRLRGCVCPIHILAADPAQHNGLSTKLKKDPREGSLYSLPTTCHSAIQHAILTRADSDRRMEEILAVFYHFERCLEAGQVSYKYCLLCTVMDFTIAWYIVCVLETAQVKAYFNDIPSL